MNFPEEYLLFQLLYRLINTPGLGGVAVGLIGGGSVLAYAYVLWWVSNGGDAEEKEIYAYPTPTLHKHPED